MRFYNISVIPERLSNFVETRGNPLRLEKSDDYVRTQTENSSMTSVTCKLCRDFELDVDRNLKKNPKAFWRFSKSKLTTKSKLGDLQISDEPRWLERVWAISITPRWFCSRSRINEYRAIDSGGYVNE